MRAPPFSVCRNRCSIGDGRLILPLPNLLQRGLGVIENLRRFLGEDRGDLGIEAARRLDNGDSGCGSAAGSAAASTARSLPPAPGGACSRNASGSSAFSAAGASS